jgi:hypothetical protein
MVVVQTLRPLSGLRPSQAWTPVTRPATAPSTPKPRRDGPPPTHTAPGPSPPSSLLPRPHLIPHPAPRGSSCTTPPKRRLRPRLPAQGAKAPSGSLAWLLARGGSPAGGQGNRQQAAGNESTTPRSRPDPWDPPGSQQSLGRRWRHRECQPCGRGHLASGRGHLARVPAHHADDPAVRRGHHDRRGLGRGLARQA